MVPDRRDPLTDLSKIVRGLYPSGTLTRTLQPRNLAKPRHGAAPSQGSGACPGFRLPIDDTPELRPWILPGLRCQPRPGRKKISPEPSGIGGSKALRPWHGLAGHFRNRVTLDISNTITNKVDQTLPQQRH
jgi:hypothetical protein